MRVFWWYMIYVMPAKLHVSYHRKAKRRSECGGAAVFRRLIGYLYLFDVAHMRRLHAARGERGPANTSYVPGVFQDATQLRNRNTLDTRQV